MSLWSNLETQSGLGSGLVWMIVGFCVVSVALYFALPVHRTRVRAGAILFFLFIFGLMVFPLVPAGTIAGQQSVSQKWVEILSSFALGAAMVTMADLIIIDIILSAVRMRPPHILSDIVLAIAYITTAFFILSHHDVPVYGIVTTSAVVTAVIGFSLQDTLGNVLGGMAIQLEHSISIGDWIRVDPHVGMVKEIRWRQTSIETRTHDTVVIPNGLLAKTNVVVLGRKAGSSRQHQQYVYFNVDFRYPPTEIINAVNAAVQVDPPPNVSVEPWPHCLLMEFKDYFATYAVRYHLTDIGEDEPADSAIRCRVVFALRRQNISMAIPAFRNFQTLDDQERQRRVEAETQEHRLAALGHVDLFAPLNEDERRFLAQRLRDCPFAAGEAMARQGDDSPCMYLITKGTAEVRLMVSPTQTHTVATLGPNQFFGEMGLLTGDHRSASVIAMTDVNCLRLDKEDFIDVLHKRPVIAEHISEILANRREALNAAREHIHGEVAKERQKVAQGDLLHRIRHFFRLNKEV
jgi:small-conductance mechanosensitive channel/CRP-like cAMP-binding protein